MPPRPSSKTRIALLGDVLKLLRQRRRPIDRVFIHPDGTIEIRLVRSDSDLEAGDHSEWSDYDASHE